MLEEQQDPEQTDLQRSKAIVAAFMFDTGDDGMIDDTGEDFVPRVQEHMEAAGEFGVAMDVADAVELAKSLKKVCCCFLQLCGLQQHPELMSSDFCALTQTARQVCVCLHGYAAKQEWLS